jgi:hypothetical protein
MGGFPALLAELNRHGVKTSGAIVPVKPKPTGRSTAAAAASSAAAAAAAAIAVPARLDADGPADREGGAVRPSPDSHEAHHALVTLKHRTAQLSSTIRAANEQTCSRLVRSVRKQAAELEGSVTAIEAAGARLAAAAASLDDLNGRCEKDVDDAGSILGLTQNMYMS